jgi:tetratricopeptide (TPR) repeat protein/SAM-dependent methyltransferase
MWREQALLAPWCPEMAGIDLEPGLPEAFQRAMACHRAGNLVEAERLYRQICAVDPQHVDSLHFLGVLAGQTGRNDVAIDLIGRALGLKPDYAEAHHNLGKILAMENRLDQAAAQYDRVLALRPDSAEAHHGLGSVLLAQGKSTKALACLERALSLEPDFAEARYDLGNILAMEGRLDQAAAQYIRVLALRPDFAEAHNSLGTVLLEQGKPVEAMACFERALALRPDFAGAHYNQGIALTKQNRLDDAEMRYERALALEPDFAAAHYNLGNVLAMRNRLDRAAAHYNRVLALRPDFAEAHNSLGTVLSDQGKSMEAMACFERALALKPDFAEAHYNQAIALTKQNRLDDAVTRYERALALKPDHSGAHCNLGNVLAKQGRLDDAVMRYRRALALEPDFAEAHNGLGAALSARGEAKVAMACFERALALKPDFADAHYNLGNALQASGRWDEARAACRRALVHKPDLLKAIGTLVALLLAEDNIAEALDLARRALAANETPETKSLFALCLRSPRLHPGMDDLRDPLVRALTEPWARPSDLAAACARLLARDTVIRDAMERAAKARPSLLPAGALVEFSGLAAFAEDRLLRALLESTPICEVALERFATGLRFTLLAAAGVVADSAVAEPVLSLCCALARQCFINNYVFAQSDAEIEQALALRDTLVAALASAADIPALSLVAVAAYVPLHTLPGAESLLDRPWPGAVTALLAQQVRAPLEERRLRASIPALTAIEDGVSVQVRGQYEDAPYPQWVKTVATGKPETPDAFMRNKFPHSPFVALGNHDGVDILVAGCGTGQHPIETTQRFKATRVLAVDLSLTSLCYAHRQTRALGLDTVQYAQADIMKLPSTARTFDVIETSGVLHHLADPFAGWRALLSMLRPGGIMLVGLYSEIARRDIVAARDFIAQRGYHPTADDIRRCRQELLDCADGTLLKNVTAIADFFSVSGCRDLLFHIQEHRLNLPEIASFIAESDLRFLGFELDPRTRRNYGRRFPGDIAMTVLEQWHRYETDNPRTFINMYQFWVQKK